MRGGRTFVMSLPKAEAGAHWPRLFAGDPDGARCLEPPYRVTESQENVLVECDLPFWTEHDDVQITIGTHTLEARHIACMHARLTAISSNR